jgi:adenylate cyclase
VDQVIGTRHHALARIETLCEPLGRKVLVSAALATAVADGKRLEPLGAHVLRGLRGPTEIFALRL